MAVYYSISSKKGKYKVNIRHANLLIVRGETEERSINLGLQSTYIDMKKKCSIENKTIGSLVGSKGFNILQPSFSTVNA
jgi:sulfite reductase alpha subunit-like flavoprotein